jgi:hypothetical protein
MCKKIFGILLIVLIFSSLFNFNPLVAAEKKTIRVITDSRIELINVVQLMTGYWPMCRLDIEYMQEVYEQFGAYWEHPVLRQYAMMWFMHGFSQEIPHALMLHLSDPPELQVKTAIPKYIMDRAGGEKKLNDFLDFLRDYAKKTKFKDFYEFHREFYRQHIKKVSDFIAEKEYIQTLENFFGPNRYSYTIILSPLVYEEGYGVNVSSQLYSIIGPSDSFERQPIFDNPQALSKQIYHDFSQSFINPLSARNRDTIISHSKLFQPIWREMMNRGYYDWEASFNEHLIRSVMIWIAFQENTMEEGENYLNETYMQGFIYTDYLHDLTLEYTNNRDIYPTYSDFYPRILDAISYLCELPYAPSYLSVNYASINGVQLEWLDNSQDEEGFIVYRRKHKNEPFQAISILLPPNQSWYRDEELSFGDKLEYKVAVVSYKGEIFTNRVSAVINPKSPLAPRNLSWTYDSEEERLEISWKYSFEVDGFVLYDLSNERSPIQTFSNEDRNYSFEMKEKGTYRFSLTAFYRKENDEPIESLDSPILTITIP